MNYIQRKALRRLGRGQTLTGTQLNDPLIRLCYDWPEGAIRPVINERGKRELDFLSRASYVTVES